MICWFSVLLIFICGFCSCKKCWQFDDGDSSMTLSIALSLCLNSSQVKVKFRNRIWWTLNYCRTMKDSRASESSWNWNIYCWTWLYRSLMNDIRKTLIQRCWITSRNLFMIFQKLLKICTHIKLHLLFPICRI